MLEAFSLFLGLQYFVTETRDSNYDINRFCKSAGCLFACLYMYIVHRRHTWKKCKKHTRCHTRIKDVLGVYAARHSFCLHMHVYILRNTELTQSCFIHTSIQRTQKIMPRNRFFRSPGDKMLNAPSHHAFSSTRIFRKNTQHFDIQSTRYDTNR